MLMVVIGIVWCVLLAIQSSLVLSLANNGQVSLTVEGGGSDLVGPHCPGTVRLVCEGVDLTILRWRYNGDIDIRSPPLTFRPDSDPMLYVLQPPFVSVELRNVSQSEIFANFSSVLVADLSQLVQENITNIRCGNQEVTCILQVNITIIEEPIPKDTKIDVNISQNSYGVLLVVYWEQQTTEEKSCTGITLYTVTLLWNGTNYTMAVNSSSCGAQCSVEFSNASLAGEENYTVYLQAINNIGESNIIQIGTIAAVIECSAPQSPLNGSIDNHLSTSPLGTTTTYQCDSDPDDVRTAVCSNVTGRGEWIPQLECEEKSANCTVELDELEHGSVTPINTSFGVTVSYTCDIGFYLSGPSTIICSSNGGWNENPGTVRCIHIADNHSSAIAVLLAIAGGVGPGCLTVGVVILLGIGVKCVCSRYQKQATEEPSPLLADGDMGVYSTLTYRSTVQRQPFPDLAAGNDELYDRIELHPSKNTESLKYVDGSTHLDQSTMPRETFPSPWPAVNYVTVDIEATEERATLMSETAQEDQELDKTFEVDRLLNLDQSLVQLRTVHNKWREIGAALHVPETHIEQVGSYYTDDDTAAMTEVLDHWIRDCSWSHTWRELAEVLSKVGEIVLAQQLMQIYETGQLPIQIDFTQVPDAMYKDRADSPPPPFPPRSPSVSWRNQETLSVQSNI